MTQMAKQSGPNPFAADTEALQRLVGETAMTWQTIEFRVCKILWMVLFDPNEPLYWATASAIYHALASFRSRLDLVDAAATHVLRGELLQQWNAFQGRLGKCAQKRNCAMHFALVHQTKLKTPPEFSAFLQDLGVHQDMGGKRQLTKSDASTNLKVMESLRADLDGFIELLRVR
jgi:hypothetical protein